MLTDSHCHLASHKFPSEEVSGIIARANQSGVTRLVSLATCLHDIESNLAIATAHQNVHCCIGIHPCDVHHAPSDVIDRLRPYLSAPQVCAIGETGLDYYHPAPDGWAEDDFRRLQRDLLEAHFKLASENNMNVVIHTRDRSGDASLQDALSIYKRHASSVRAVFHCFISSTENAEAIISLGGLVSFGGVSTFKNASEVLGIAASLKAGTFMLETDSPYLAPHPFRGQRNEPARLRTIAEKIADARKQPLESLAEETNRAAFDFFRGIE